MSKQQDTHTDAKVLIRRAAAQLRAWHDLYGQHNPPWLPPCGDVRWLEDAQAWLDEHTLPAPTAPQPEHVCGLQGFGALGDECPACKRWREEYEAKRRQTKSYEDGTTATGPAPLPDFSPRQQATDYFPRPTLPLPSDGKLTDQSGG